MSAIDENGQANCLWSAEICECVHCGADGTACVEDVVDEYYDHVGDVEGYFGASYDRLGLSVRVVDVIAIKCDVETAVGDVFLGFLGDFGGDPLGDDYASASQADDGDVGF